MKEEVSAGIILFNDVDKRKFLLLNYPSKHCDFVKGKMEKDETPHETAIRETKEETGISDVEFIDGFENLINLSTKKGLEEKRFKINTPLINLTKKDIILLGKKNGVNFSKTSSCYDPKDKKVCGSCDACLLRSKGFEEAKIDDPAR